MFVDEITLLMHNQVKLIQDLIRTGKMNEALDNVVLLDRLSHELKLKLVNAEALDSNYQAKLHPAANTAALQLANSFVDSEGSAVVNASSAVDFKDGLTNPDVMDVHAFSQLSPEAKSTYQDAKQFLDHLDSNISPLSEVGSADNDVKDHDDDALLNLESDVGDHRPSKATDSQGDPDAQLADQDLNADDQVENKLAEMGELGFEQGETNHEDNEAFRHDHMDDEDQSNEAKLASLNTKAESMALRVKMASLAQRRSLEQPSSQTRVGFYAAPSQMQTQTSESRQPIVQPGFDATNSSSIADDKTQSLTTAEQQQAALSAANAQAEALVSVSSDDLMHLLNTDQNTTINSQTANDELDADVNKNNEQDAEIIAAMSDASNYDQKLAEIVEDSTHQLQKLDALDQTREDNSLDEIMPDQKPVDHQTTSNADTDQPTSNDSDIFATLNKRLGQAKHDSH